MRIDPPAAVADQILGMIGEWPFPPLRGVIATQTMRYDGTLLTEPGYDEATGLVLFNPPKMPEIPPHPTKDEALDALALLRDLLDEVDFAEDGNVSLSGAVSMMMTPVLRGMMPVVPMHVVNKPSPEPAARICRHHRPSLSASAASDLPHAEQRRREQRLSSPRSPVNHSSPSITLPAP